MASMMEKNEITPHVAKEGEFDPLKAFKKRKQEDEQPLGFTPDNVIEYNQDDIRELEEYCKSRGIIGVGFGKMSPKSILNMLKNKNGIPTEGKFSSKQILLG
jgi:hypothetical protein